MLLQQHGGWSRSSHWSDCNNSCVRHAHVGLHRRAERSHQVTDSLVGPMKQHVGDRQFHTNHEVKYQFVNGWEYKILISTVMELLNSCQDGTSAPLCWRRMKNNTLLSKMSNTVTSLCLHCFQGYTAFSCNTQLVDIYFSGSLTLRTQHAWQMWGARLRGRCKGLKQRIISKRGKEWDDNIRRRIITS